MVWVALVVHSSFYIIVFHMECINKRPSVSEDDVILGELEDGGM